MPAGVKLDFKSISALAPALTQLDLCHNEAAAAQTAARPLWLNADILPGPGHNETYALDATSTGHSNTFSVPELPSPSSGPTGLDSPDFPDPGIPKHIASLFVRVFRVPISTRVVCSFCSQADRRARVPAADPRALQQLGHWLWRRGRGASKRPRLGASAGALRRLARRATRTRRAAHARPPRALQGCARWFREDHMDTRKICPVGLDKSYQTKSPARDSSNDPLKTSSPPTFSVTPPPR